jgi:hypothetical protein
LTSEGVSNGRIHVVIARFDFSAVAAFTFACLAGQLAPAQQQTAPEILEYKGKPDIGDCPEMQPQTSVSA